MLFNTNITQCLDPVRNALRHCRRWTGPNVGMWKEFLYLFLDARLCPTCTVVLLLSRAPRISLVCPLCDRKSPQLRPHLLLPCLGPHGPPPPWEDCTSAQGGSERLGEEGCPSWARAPASPCPAGRPNFRTVFTFEAQANFRLSLIRISFEALTMMFWQKRGYFLEQKYLRSYALAMSRRKLLGQRGLLAGLSRHCPLSCHVYITVACWPVKFLWPRTKMHPALAWIVLMCDGMFAFLIGIVSSHF